MKDLICLEEKQAKVRNQKIYSSEKRYQYQSVLSICKCKNMLLGFEERSICFVLQHTKSETKESSKKFKINGTANNFDQRHNFEMDTRM